VLIAHISMADQTQPPRRQREFPTAGMIEPDRYAIHRVRFTAVTFTSFISMKLGNTEIRLLATNRRNSGGRLSQDHMRPHAVHRGFSLSPWHLIVSFSAAGRSDLCLTWNTQAVCVFVCRKNYLDTALDTGCTTLL